MRTFQFPSGDSLRLLCLGAHSDDIEIGCGGTVLKLIERYKSLDVSWIVFSADKTRAGEALASARSFLRGIKKRSIEVLGFRESYFPFVGAAIKDFFEKLKAAGNPDLILTHQRQDLHQDHRLISDLTWNTFRDHPILEYEILKYDGDLGSPNVFVPLEKRVCRKKVKLVVGHFRSQRKKGWFSEDAFLSLLRLRGVEANSPSGFAEGFYGRKIIF